LEKVLNNKEDDSNSGYSYAQDAQLYHMILDSTSNHFRTIIEKAPIGVSINRNGMILFANQVYAKMFGFKSAAELINTPVLAQFIPLSRDKIADVVHRRIKSGRLPVSLETVGRRCDGTVFSVLVQVDRILLPDGPADVVFYTDNADIKRKVKQTAEGLESGLGKIQRLLLDIASALGTALDIRDPYTAEHQKKVVRLARVIAEEMGLPKERIESIEIAGNLHDIGKIKVPIEILSKSGQLSDLEFEIIKTHCQVGYDIIKSIDFPWPVGEIILQHHERIDGSGYPRGLKRENILIEAQILAVADVVEAMSSHRPYRPSLGINAALEEIEKNRGILYEPEVVDVCLRLFREDRFSFN
jgi:PAS domain S-box-containing protein/putative nucleotidyltransferase with HDIG domain